MRTLVLNVSVQGTVNASGGATVSTGPQHVNEIWFPTSVSISCSGTIPTPSAPTIATCQIYAGFVVAQNTFVDGTYQVLGASSSIINGTSVYPGSSVFAVWTACNTGQTVTMNITGTRQMP
jgi:hypothetical protein